MKEEAKGVKLPSNTVFRAIGQLQKRLTVYRKSELKPAKNRGIHHPEIDDISEHLHRNLSQEFSRLELHGFRKTSGENGITYSLETPLGREEHHFYTGGKQASRLSKIIINHPAVSEIQMEYPLVGKGYDPSVNVCFKGLIQVDWAKFEEELTRRGYIFDLLYSPKDGSKVDEITGLGHATILDGKNPNKVIAIVSTGSKPYVFFNSYGKSYAPHLRTILDLLVPEQTALPQVKLMGKNKWTK